MNGVLLVMFCCGLAAIISLAQDKPCQPHKHAKLPPITEFTYSKARKKLLAAGWQPLQTKSFNEADEDPDIKYGNGPLFWKRGYVELESCSGTGVAACAFLFKDAYGNHLRVTTAGEELQREKAYARVTGFRFVCELDKQAVLVRAAEQALAADGFFKDYGHHRIPCVTHRTRGAAAEGWRWIACLVLRRLFAKLSYNQ